MGTFFHPITIVGPNGEETIDALVDRSIPFARVSSNLLERLGILPYGRKYGGAPIGQARAWLDGRAGWPIVIFTEPFAQARIGWHTLDSFLVDVDEQGSPVEKVFIQHSHLS